MWSTLATRPSSPAPAGARRDGLANLIRPHVPLRLAGPPRAPSRPAWLSRDGVDVLTWHALEDLPVDAVVTTRDGGVSNGPFASLNLALHVGDDAGGGAREPSAGPPRSGRHRSTTWSSPNRSTAPGAGRSAAPIAVGAPAPTDALPASRRAGHRGPRRGPRGPGRRLRAGCPLRPRGPGVLGCAHAGWSGALRRRPRVDARRRWRRSGHAPSRWSSRSARRSPADAYEVGPDVVDAAVAHLGAGSPTWRPGRAGHWFFDLAAAVRAVLVRAGVPAAQIVDTGVPTTGPAGPFFSARAEGTCGRFGLLARIRLVSAEPVLLRGPRARHGHGDPHLPLLARGPVVRRAHRARRGRLGHAGGGRGGPPRPPAGRGLVLQDLGAAGGRARRRPPEPPSSRCSSRTSTATGLGEFAYRNRLDLSALEITGRGLERRRRRPRRRRPAARSIPFGGGIDSIVTVEAVKRAHPGASLFVVSPRPAVRGDRAGRPADRPAGRAGRPGTSTPSCSSPSRAPGSSRATSRSPASSPPSGCWRRPGPRHRRASSCPTSGRPPPAT